MVARRTRSSDPDGVPADDATRRERLIRQLVDLRRSSGVTQAAIAAAMHVGQSTVAEIESGKLDVRYSTLDRYAAAVSAGRLRLDLVATPDVDRTEIRRAIRMTDREREAYYLASNRNMLRMFAGARRTS